jgi:hypothetical protein
MRFTVLVPLEFEMWPAFWLSEVSQTLSQERVKAHWLLGFLECSVRDKVPKKSHLFLLLSYTSTLKNTKTLDLESEATC